MSRDNDQQIFKAFGEPIRLRIVVLLTAGEVCVCELMKTLGLPQSTVSRHMSRLKRAGIVTAKRHGKWVHYRLSPRPSTLMKTMIPYLEGLRGQSPYKTDLKQLTAYRKRKPCE